MNKLILSAFVLTMILTNLSTAQTKSVLDILNSGNQKPFAKIDAHLEKNNLEFDNDEQTVKLFNQERIQLGANFETELWKYLGDNLTKHYWISGFLEYDNYLQGNKSLPQLAFKIREKGVGLPVANDDYPGLGNKFTMLRDMAVYLYLEGKRDSAIAHKKKAEVLYKEIKDYGVVGATYEYIMCIYDNLDKDTSGCKEEMPKENNSTSQKQNASYSNTFSGDVINGNAISLPAPEYPKAASAVGAAGTVNVKVIIDTNGNVISAEAVSGHLLLQSAAIDAAKKAKFKPFIKDGKTFSVSGIIVYNFTK